MRVALMLQAVDVFLRQILTRRNRDHINRRNHRLTETASVDDKRQDFLNEPRGRFRMFRRQKLDVALKSILPFAVQTMRGEAGDRSRA